MSDHYVSRPPFNHSILTKPVGTLNHRSGNAMTWLLHHSLSVMTSLPLLAITHNPHEMLLSVMTSLPVDTWPVTSLEDLLDAYAMYYLKFRSRIIALTVVHQFITHNDAHFQISRRMLFLSYHPIAVTTPVQPKPFNHIPLNKQNWLSVIYTPHAIEFTAPYLF